MSDEIKKRKMLLRDFQNGLPAHIAMARIEEKFGKKGFGIRTCQRWFKKFRSGDLNLEERPSSGYESRRKQTNRTKQKRAPQKEVQVELVTFKQEQRKPDSRIQNSSMRTEAVQKLIQRKPEITVSKVNGGVVANRVSKSNIITKRAILLPPHTNRNSAVFNTKAIVRRPASDVPVVSKKQKVSNGPPPTMPKLRPVHGLETDLKLPPSIAKRMVAPQTSTESHSISEVRKSAQKTGEAVKKKITVQFQNVNPDIAKNTVRRTTDPALTAPLNGNKRLTVPQSTPLSSPKGVIYLNPQEIFRQNFGYPNTVQRPTHNGAFPKPVGNVPKTQLLAPQLAAPPQATPSTVELSDSDSEDDLLFPQDVAVPPPKVKAIAETFTTYWDMETDKPILLNPAEEPIPPTPPVIEID